MANEETIEIKWHPYPKEKPKESGGYLATYKYFTSDYMIHEAVNAYYYVDKIDYWNISSNAEVIAWAELPRPLLNDKET